MEVSRNRTAGRFASRRFLHVGDRKGRPYRMKADVRRRGGPCGRLWEPICGTNLHPLSQVGDGRACVETGCAAGRQLDTSQSRLRRASSPIVGEPGAPPAQAAETRTHP